VESGDSVFNSALTPTSSNESGETAGKLPRPKFANQVMAMAGLTKTSEAVAPTGRSE
jgi:hypothetical protein